jgi:Ca-activated chloride channel family protein
MTETSKNQKVKTPKPVPVEAVCTMLFVAIASSVMAQGAPEPAKPKESAPSLVRRGNKLLLEEKPGEAIEIYDEAQKVAPDAREIAFGKGLGYYKLGEFDKARSAFEEAAAARDDSLADDALYSIGTVDHTEALAGQGGDPKASMSKLESAMQSYQNVLARNPQHAAARDANLKAATMWRQIKEQMQQQQQQQSDQNQDQNQDEKQEQQEQQQQDQQQEQQENQDQQQQNQEQQEQQQQDQQEQDQQEQSQQQQSDQSQEQQEKQSSKEQQEQEQTAEQQQEMNEEQVSREQAERQLREMLQALRDRKKERREPAKPMPIQRGEKDW